VGSGLLPLPATIDPRVTLISDGALNPIRQLATVTTITTSEWHGVNSAGMTAAFSAEATEVADGTPTLVQPIIKAEKGQTYAEFSIEAGLDWASLADEMTRLISDAKDVLEADRFISGTGTNQPEGLVAGLAASSIITAAGTASFAVADVYKMQNSLPARFSPRARWLSSLTIGNLSWQFVAAGSTTAARIWDDARTSLLGKPWSEVSTMSTVLTTGALNLLYGDIASAYKTVDRIGLSVELVPLVMGASRRPTGTRGLPPTGAWARPCSSTTPSGCRRRASHGRPRPPPRGTRGRHHRRRAGARRPVALAGELHPGRARAPLRPGQPARAGARTAQRGGARVRR
jgi:predicted phage gp36 major capsid-like protein